MSDLPPNAPEFGVLEMDDGRVYGKQGWVLGTNGKVLPELSWFGGPSDRIRVPSKLPTPVRARGRCVSLVSDWSYKNYAHFLLDGLGRLGLLLQAGITIADVDHFLCPTPPSPAADGLFDAFGIPAEKRIFATPEIVVQADIMFVPSCPVHDLVYWPWLPRFLRTAIPTREHEAPTRRLYVSRRDATRRALPEDGIEEILRDNDFEIYVPGDHVTQPYDFHNAAVVVGAHGAGLANLAFCQAGSKVLEIIPTDNAYPFYYSLALAAGLDYGSLVGTSSDERRPGTFGPSTSDFLVDLDELRSALDELLES